MDDAHTPTTEPTDFVFTVKITVRATQGETEDEVFRWLMNCVADIPDVVDSQEA